MYELINEADRLLIVKYEERLGRQSKVFALAVHDESAALEILRALNHPEDNAV